MNHLKHISYRSPCRWLQKSQSVTSRLSSNIQIPLRIERRPTDILRALDRSVPRDPLSTSYKYHDDPYLIPMKRSDYRIYALSYESGRDTAMWIHKEHANYFPKDLSVPRIKAFVPPVAYKDKSQVSEEIFLQAVAETNVSDALHIYNLLEGDVSNTAKQNLLELLCFCNSREDTFKMLPHDQWFNKPDTQLIWTPNPLVEQLYNFLKTQDHATACKAHNTVICGFAKWKKIDETWLLYEECKKNDIPLNVDTYNYLIELLIETYPPESCSESAKSLYEILKHMNTNGVRPNVRTLNAALSVASTFSNTTTAEHLAKHLLIEFKRLNIKLSLASYNYAITIFTRAGDVAYNSFMDLLNSAAGQSFTVQDPKDVKFFVTAIDTAYYTYFDKEAGEKVYDILFTGDNYQFLHNLTNEAAFFYVYTMLMLSTNTIPDFFERYQKIVPNLYIPDYRVYKEILNSMKMYPSEEVAEYLPKFWTDMETFKVSDSDLSLNAMEIMSRAVSQAQPAVKATFASAAKRTWRYIKDEMEQSSKGQFSTATIGYMALLLLKNGDVKECNEVLKYTVENLNSFMPMMSKEQVDKLFELCISERYFTEALLVLEYCVNVGFQHVVDMAGTLHSNDADLDNVQRNKLKSLMKGDV
ncbi:small ribosomal subunit protein mS39 [Lasioglossum baleicum]|uniref:small ribosomal subunit protein mS39 n=1 Tax=Lasioglossum baleicum TaxID=434251 RepID=UPI003FCD2812